jgi:hypothetical protein
MAHSARPTTLAGGFLLLAALTACRSQEPSVPVTQTAQSVPSKPSDLGPKIARFAPTDISADVSKLSAPDRLALAKLIEASKVLDGVYLRQIWVGNEAMLIDLARDESPAGRDRLHFFLINKGPWSRLDHNESFVPGGRQLLSGWRDEGRDREVDPVALGGRARPRDRVLHGHPPGIERAVHGRSLQRRVPERAGAGGRIAARGGRAVGGADAEDVSQ